MAIKEPPLGREAGSAWQYLNLTRDRWFGNYETGPSPQVGRNGPSGGYSHQHCKDSQSATLGLAGTACHRTLRGQEMGGRLAYQSEHLAVI